MFDNKSGLFIYGIGNIGRQDDGLGWAFIEKLEESLPANVETFRNYQLNIEDAELISHHSQVLFVDASKDETLEDFRCSKVEAQSSTSFTSHYLNMQSVLALCHNVYKKQPVTNVIEIRGYEWELQQGLTGKAQFNLDKAITFFKQQINS